MILTLGLDSADTPAHIEMFANQGVKEFFAGYVPKEWSETFGWEIEMNRRTFGASVQFTDLEMLRAAIDTAHENGIAFIMALNGHDYGYHRLGMLREIVNDLEGLGPDGYVVADPNLMRHLRAWGVTRDFHLSTGAGTFNSESVRFFHERYGVTRVVIPRKVSLREIKVFMDNLSDLDLEFEVMVIGYRCHFNDEFCFSLHSGVCNNLCSSFVRVPQEIRARFPADWKQSLEQTIEFPDNQFSEGSATDLFSHEMAELTPKFPAPEEIDEKGSHSKIMQTFYVNCGLCAIPELVKLGVQVLKIPVRGASWQKVKYVQSVQCILSHGSEASPSLCRSIINSAGFCNAVDSCYYALEEDADEL